MAKKHKLPQALLSYRFHFVSVKTNPQKCFLSAFYLSWKIARRIGHNVNLCSHTHSHTLPERGAYFLGAWQWEQLASRNPTLSITSYWLLVSYFLHKVVQGKRGVTLMGN